MTIELVDNYTDEVLARFNERNVHVLQDLPFPADKIKWLEDYCHRTGTITLEHIVYLLKCTKEKKSIRYITNTSSLTKTQARRIRENLDLRVSAKQNRTFKYFISEDYKPEDDEISWDYFLANKLLNADQLSKAKTYCAKRNLTPNHMRILVEGLKQGDVPLKNLCIQSGFTYKQANHLKDRWGLIDNRRQNYNRLKEDDAYFTRLAILNDMIRAIPKSHLPTKHHLSKIVLNRIYDNFVDELQINRDSDYEQNIQRHLTINRNISISPLIREINVGTLLGDGNLVQTNNSQIRIATDINKYQSSIDFFTSSRTSIDKKSKEDLKKLIPLRNNYYDYLLHVPLAKMHIGMKLDAFHWLKSLEYVFESENIPCRVSLFNSTNRWTKEKIKNSYFATRSSIQYFDELLNWYPQGTKIVPHNINLSPTTCLVWLLDDGCSSNDKIQLLTLSFTKPEVEFLTKKLTQLGFYARCAKETKKDHPKPEYYENHYWKINLGKWRNVEKFFDFCKQGDQRLVRTIEKYYSHKFEV